MRSALSRKLLLAAALILGQWLLVAHAFEHPVSANDLTCQLCHVGHRTDAAPPPAIVQVVHAQATYEAPTLAATPAPRVAPLTRYPIRGPPLRLR
ncbi:MAG TPA: hypothetical protein VGE57_09885 [Solimonas sp.]